MTRRVEDAASENSAILRASWEPSDPTDARVARAFVSFVEGADISSNVDSHKLTVFNRVGEVLDLRRIVAQSFGGNIVSAVEELLEDAWFRRRQAFEALWVHGDRFVYAAFNFSLLGPTDYGPFCLVFTPPASPLALAVFPCNSAAAYVDEHGHCYSEKARSEATLWNERGLRLALSNSSSIRTTPKADWPTLMEQVRSMPEIVITPLPLSALTEVRIGETFRDLVEEIEEKKAVGAALTAREEHLHAGHMALLDIIDDFALELNVYGDI